MKNFVPYEKLSKKEKRKIDAARRSSWGDISPVTRKAKSIKVYDRNKIRSLEREPYGRPNFGSCLFICRAFDSPHRCAFSNPAPAVCCHGPRRSHS